MIRLFTLLLSAATLSLSICCSGSSTGVEAEGNEPEVTTGELEVTAATTGSGMDPDG